MSKFYWITLTEPAPVGKYKDGYLICQLENIYSGEVLKTVNISFQDNSFPLLFSDENLFEVVFEEPESAEQIPTGLAYPFPKEILDKALKTDLDLKEFKDLFKNGR